MAGVPKSSFARAATLAALPGLAGSVVVGVALGHILDVESGVAAAVCSAGLVCLIASVCGRRLVRLHRHTALTPLMVRRVALRAAMTTQAVATLVVSVLLSLPLLLMMAWLFIIPASLVVAVVLTWPLSVFGAMIFCRSLGIMGDNSPV